MGKLKDKAKNLLSDKPEYYSLNEILKLNALYNVIISGRSNGKTFAVMEYAIREYFDHGKELVIIRRWHDDFIGNRGLSMFKNQVSSGNVDRLSGGLWSDVFYYRSQWFFCKYDEKGNRIRSEKPFAYAMALDAVEHDKSTAYPDVGTILFDEFISKRSYQADEFIMFENCISTIIRQRDNVKIFMLGNLINKYCPYFAEMGLKHIRDMEPGAIDLYTYGTSGLTVAVEYALNKVGKLNEKFFAFDNPKLKMITGEEWELSIYPHLPIKYKPNDVRFTFFINFDGEILQCEIVHKEVNDFVYIHRKTTPIQDDDRDVIFMDRFSPKRNHYISIIKPIDELSRKIIWYFTSNNVYYQNNEIGETVSNYIAWCKKLSV